MGEGIPVHVDTRHDDSSDKSNHEDTDYYTNESDSVDWTDEEEHILTKQAATISSTSKVRASTDAKNYLLREK